MNIRHPTVLLVGWRDLYIRACSRLGVDAVTAYWSSDKKWRMPLSAQRPAKAMMVENTASPEALLAGLVRSGIDGRELAGIIATGESTVAAAAMLSEHFGIPGVTVDTALCCRDKGLMKERIIAAGAAPTPGFCVIDDIGEASAAFLAGLKYPLVIKPVAGAGSACARCVVDPSELTQVLDELRATDHVAFIAEEFSPGAEWHIDGVVMDGSVQFISVGAYGSNLIKVHDGDLACTTILHPERDRWAYDLAWPTAERVMRALGHHDGVFHLETFYPDGGADLIFGECAARLGGSGIPEAISLARGVDLAAADIQILTGLQPTLSGSMLDQYVGMVYLPIVEGVLVRAPAVREIEAQPGVRDATVILPRGYPMSKQGMDISWHVGRAVVQGDTRAQVEQRMRDLAAWFMDSLVVSDEEPSSFDMIELWRADDTVRSLV